ncbi:MAG: DUF3641 domain-containing protein [Peptococcaceae bacterium]|nr:DUF3641 domain-containing protein [Peptococcaceae bacterium]
MPFNVLTAYPLKSNRTMETMQINIGKICNLSCKHCHVEAGPNRTESMTQNTMAQCLQVMADYDIKTLDITGGAPELNPNFMWLIQEAAHLRRHVMLRTNLTLLDKPGYNHLPEFFARNRVELVSSLPYYSSKDADRQRGNGVFQNSIDVLRGLNDLGYGQEKSGLKLHLAYNPGGAFLPAPQQAIEADYRRVLTLSNPMCRNQISVSWDGYLYDCDFNQMLGLPFSPRSISKLCLADFQERQICVNNHCYACTAGSGSSCGGTVV